MLDGRLLTWSLIGLGVGIFLFVKGFNWKKQQRLIENLPTSKIRSIAMGLVELVGKAVVSKVMKSPFSNKDCVYYKYTIEQYRRSGKNSRWVKVKVGEKRDYFYLKDSSGTVLIDPIRAKIDIPRDNQFNSSMGRDPPIAVKKFLSSQGVGFEGFFGINKRMRYTEYFIAPGDNLYVIGTAGDNPFVKDGSAKSNVEDIMIKKGKDFYYISDKSEKEVLKTFKWKVIGGLYGGTALILGCLAIIFAFFGFL